MATIRQKKAFKKIMENNGNVSRGMMEVGYSPQSAKNPKNLINSKGWQELMDEYLPDSLIAKKHLELLNKQEVITKNNVSTGEVDVKYTGQIDVNAVKAGLDMAYKLKGKYAAEKIDVKQSDYDEEQIEAIAKRIADKRRNDGDGRPPG